ncbi:MAG TPA: tyrosine--tRNA ligase [Rhabdochlamydiaceae bacterium]|jgi:tyrosyl-tRNA synthetase
MTNVIEILKERGLIEAVTHEELAERVEKPINLYFGCDPSADSLHVGNLVGIIVLRWFQKYGHTPFVILGGATGRIGDPSGKSLERPLLDAETIHHNIRRIAKNFESILDFTAGSNRPILLNNDQWFARFPLIDFLRDIGKHFRVGSMLAKESVKARLQSEEGISFTEFSYQLLQAYDFYHLHLHHNVELQIGGSDQWGNITAGTELIRKLGRLSAFGLTFPLLTRSDGKKFGKSEEGAIWLSADRCSPYQFYQYFVRMADADVIKLMRMLTFMEMGEIREYQDMMGKKDYIPNTAQKKLAEELTLIVHGKEGLETALKVTEGASPGSQTELNPDTLREIAKDMPSMTLQYDEIVGKRYVDVVVKIGLLSSKSEAVRLIQNGGAYLNNERVSDPHFQIENSFLIGGEFLLFGLGKKKKMILSIKR